MVLRQVWFLEEGYVTSVPPCRAKMQVLCFQFNLNVTFAFKMACFHVKYIVGSFSYPFCNLQLILSQLHSVIAKDISLLVQVAFPRCPVAPFLSALDHQKV